MSKLNKRCGRIPLKIKALGADGTFSGYGSVFGVIDSYKERVMPGAFARSIEAKGAAGIAMLWQHQADCPIGVYTEIREDDHGLYVEGKLALETEKGREAYALMKEGWQAGLSIGFMPEDVREAKGESGVSELYEVDLWEVSIVTFQANLEAFVQEVRSIQEVRAKVEKGEDPTKRELERLLTRDAGLSRSKAAALLAGGYSAMTDTRDADSMADELWNALASIAQTEADN